MQASWSLSSRSDDESILTLDSPIDAITPTSPNRDTFSPARHPFVDTYLVSQQPSKPLSPQLQREFSLGTHLLDGFPIPHARTRKGATREAEMVPELAFLDATGEEDALEAAWEDHSATDDSEPRVKHSDKLAGLARSLQRDSAGFVEDQFEVHALKRQVEQLQMALQLQGHQLAVAEAKQLRTRKSSSQMRRESVDLPPLPEVPSHRSGRVMQRPSRSNLRPAYSASMASHDSRCPTSSMMVGPPATRSCEDRLQSETSRETMPMLSGSTTADEKKLEDLNQKVHALEQLVASIYLHPTAPHAFSIPIDHRNSSSASSTPPRSTVSSSRSYNTSTITLPSNQPVTKSNKLASMFKSRTAPLIRDESTKINWGKKRTDDDAPKVKVRQGPGRGRMVIKDVVGSN